MTKYKEETKKKLIYLMKNQLYSFYSAANEINISDLIAKHWWKMYEAHGYEGLVMKYGTYTQKEKEVF